MYFVNRQSILERIDVIHSMIQFYDTNKNPKNKTDELAFERMTQLLIDSILDIGNAMIDGFIMRDPGSYEDIVDILMDEKVITQKLGESIKALIPIRKHLLQDYTKSITSELVSTLEGNIDLIREFPQSVQAYLDKELGTVNAFSPEEK